MSTHLPWQVGARSAPLLLHRRHKAPGQAEAALLFQSRSPADGGGCIDGGGAHPTFLLPSELLSSNPPPPRPNSCSVLPAHRRIHPIRWLLRPLGAKRIVGSLATSRWTFVAGLHRESIIGVPSIEEPKSSKKLRATNFPRSIRRTHRLPKLPLAKPKICLHGGSRGRARVHPCSPPVPPLSHKEEPAVYVKPTSSLPPVNSVIYDGADQHACRLTTTISSTSSPELRPEVKPTIVSLRPS
jgi:hypothetical protein